MFSFVSGAAGGAPPPPQPAPSSQPQQPNYLQQPQNTYPQPPSGAHAPPSTPSEPAYPSMPSQPPAQPAPVPAPRQQVWVPPSNPSKYLSVPFSSNNHIANRYLQLYIVRFKTSTWWTFYENFNGKGCHLRIDCLWLIENLVEMDLLLRHFRKEWGINGY